jgi:hypothetical protein
MAYDVSALGSYTQPNEKTVLVKTVLGPKTIAKIESVGNVLTGVKSKIQLPNLDTDAVFQDGSACGFTAAGTTKVTTRELEVGNIKVNESLCPKDFEKTYEQLNLTKGSEYTEALHAEEYIGLKGKKIAKALEVAVWKGDKASANAQLKRFDGFIKIIDTDGTAVDGNTGGVTVATGISKANIEAILDAMYEAITEDLIENDDNYIACGSEVFRAYIMAMRDKNYFKDYKVDGESGQVTIVGTNVTLMSTPGLNNTKRLFGFSWSNMWFGTDMLEETEAMNLSYAPEAEQVRFKANFKAGVQVAFPEEIVQFTLVP